MTTSISGTSGITFPNGSNQDVGAVGVGQTWQSVTRNIGTNYTNDTGKPIMLSVINQVNNTGGTGCKIVVGGVVVASSMGYAGGIGMSTDITTTAIIPSGASYQLTGNAGTCAELR